ncbi:MAG: hypothetical protein QNJ97_19955 [Myxococcota bacterium]|nr:hypothetical protein [Myxococcota bacterium]
MLFKSKKIKSKLVPLENISEQMIREMHALFIQYYEHADYETFKKDLSQKTGTFMWWERETGQLIAFINMKIMALPYKGRNVHVFFCGDTVCHRSYWQRNSGQINPMAGTLFAYLVRFLLRHPFSAYWFMISMSFRTYLVIANNLVNYYPHYQRNDRKTQKLKEICHLVADHMYGDKFDPETGLVDFGLGDKNQTIKSDVAPVTEEMLQKYPKIAFYESLNPDNQKGIEMACIGALDFDAAISYLKKFTQRIFMGAEKQKKTKRIPGRSFG